MAPPKISKVITTMTLIAVMVNTVVVMTMKLMNQPSMMAIPTTSLSNARASAEHGVTSALMMRQMLR